MKRTTNRLLVVLGSALLAPVASAAPLPQTATVSSPPPTSATGAQDDSVDAGSVDQARPTNDLRSETDMSGWGMDTADDPAPPPEYRTGSAQRADRSRESRPTVDAASDRHALWRRLDSNGDGRISAAEGEVDAGFRAAFAAMDVDHDGFVSDVEYRADASMRPGTPPPRGTAGRMHEDLSGTGMLEEESGRVDLPPPGDRRDDRH